MPQKHLGYSSAQKAIEILLAFVPDNREMGTLELSRLLRLNKSTVSRLIRVLEHYSLLHQDDSTKKYSLGRSAAFIGKAFQESLSTRLVAIAQPFTNSLRDTIGESVCLEVMSGDHVYLVAKAVGPPPLSISFKDRIPIHAAAGAKSILAFFSPEAVERLINRKLARLTPNTITDPDVLRTHLKEIRRQGVAFDRGEDNIDVHAIGAPIFNHEGEPIAAICVCVPASRMDSYVKSNIVSKLKETAAKISDRFFYSEDKHFSVSRMN
jgi:DNA-binding IclR family transcriptional regulator